MPFTKYDIIILPAPEVAEKWEHIKPRAKR